MLKAKWCRHGKLVSAAFTSCPVSLLLVRDFAKHKMDLARAAEKANADRLQKQMIEVNQLRRLQQERAMAVREARISRNKGIQRVHERWGRDTSKQKEDDQTRRLEALKANDFEAYQELLRQTKGPLFGDDRFHGE
jgi:SWI/SNF-related matrix-associated actin-dependent regulator of chromatin subfamily A protein 2/4